MALALSPYVRVALDYTIPSYWPFRERVIYDYELLLVKEGEIIITVDGAAHHCLPGDLFLIKPGRTHMMEPTGSVAFRHPHVHFDLVEDETSPLVKVNFAPLDELSGKERAMIRRDLLSAPPFCLPDHIRLHSSAAAEEMLFEIIHEMQLQRPFYQQRCKGLMISLLVDIARQLRHDADMDKPPEQKAVERIMLLMRQRLGEQLPLDQLAHEAGYSRSHLTHLFTQLVGTSPVKYHQSLRLLKARQLLANSSLPVSAVAALCGYKSVYAFSNAFKEAYGHAPSRYRQGAQAELPQASAPQE